MRYDEFLARVRELGEYRDRQEAEEVTTAVLEVLASRITPGETEDLAAQLPGPLGDFLMESSPERPETYGVEEFCRRVGERTGSRPRTAEWDASAVLSTTAGAVSGGELNQVLSQLPSGYAALFGKPELSD
ncbi:DUF2267 domain-containing protein [Streptomyces radiopugnans]|uniref:DUF2267 domain-containing protein n=1 Tax=Streptomyces radiopugnans TaxID=403935 RepID=UPI003F1BB025